LHAFLDDRHQYINADRNPDLGLHRIVGGSVKGFDAQVLLDSLKEYFNPPAAAI